MPAYWYWFQLRAGESSQPLNEGTGQVSGCTFAGPTSEVFHAGWMKMSPIACRFEGLKVLGLVYTSAAGHTLAQPHLPWGLLPSSLPLLCLANTGQRSSQEVRIRDEQKRYPWTVKTMINIGHPHTPARRSLWIWGYRPKGSLQGSLSSPVQL